MYAIPEVVAGRFQRTSEALCPSRRPSPLVSRIASRISAFKLPVSHLSVPCPPRLAFGAFVLLSRPSFYVRAVPSDMPLIHVGLCFRVLQDTLSMYSEVIPEKLKL